MPLEGGIWRAALLEKALRWWLQPQERGWSRVIQRLHGSWRGGSRIPIFKKGERVPFLAE